MIKSIIATTREIDDPKTAVAEIKAALDLGHELLKNSLGIISCFSDFADTGVLQAICDALPFDCIGATTLQCAANGEIDQILLTLTVLTSDDCDFKTALIPVSEGYEAAIDSKVSELLGYSDEKPALLLGYFPLMTTLSGDMLLSAIDKVTGGIPLFGTLAVDHTMEYTAASTIYNGKAYREAVVLGGVFGSPTVTFEVASLNEERVRRQKAIITESTGNILIGVNGKTALEYLEEVGLTKEQLSFGVGIVPLFINHNDGTKAVARAVFGVTPDGHAVCGGAMPMDATLALGRVDKEDVLQTTEKVLSPLVQKDSTILSYSCIARYLALEGDSAAEGELAINVAKDSHYTFANSGGELCPLPDADGNLKNYFHNFTIVFCRLS